MHKAGFVTILGNPNVGKSTLMNELVGERISIITQKAQTTRHRILGVISEDDYQIIFSDTPGVINPHHDLHEAMMKFVDTSLEGADVILYMVDCSKEDLKDVKFLKKINASKTPIVLLINKIDLVDQDEANSLIDYWTRNLPHATIIPLSALKKFNIESLNNKILELIPESPPYFSKDTLTDKSERFIVSEIVREKILERYKQEIPYSVEVVVNSFKDKGKVIVIDATIYVERESQKGIVLGKKGVAINSVGTAARKTMQNFFKKKIFLGLFVKVSKDWRSKKTQLKKFGYN
ncbi:MAG: GTPase Era [Flavobacteriales bacterium]|jgi:GTP-binding protein Era|nr:GTPase Era [Flavobacteriales bacterium]|tara:strand:- start:373 stop:1248 length:876 start_codon:yes stop_codon:yes gene_type:complete